jgi:Common central domain of tyrosinase
MMPSRILTAAMVVASLASGTAYAGACAGGGSLDITASADSLALPPVAATTFNFGEHVILTAIATGFTIASYSWSIDGPTIKDYSEGLGTVVTSPPPAALPWSTTPLSPSDLTGTAPVGFYFVPSAAQFEPNNGPFTRNVMLTVTKNGGGTCNTSVALSVERNESDMTRKAEDFYTSNHRAATATNPLDGHVIDEHLFWHMNIDGSQPSFPAWMGFLAWHGEFVRRFDLWRQEFGYNKVAPWYPGRPLPTGPQFAVNPSLRNAYSADDLSNHIPTYFTLTGGTTPDPNASGQLKLADYATLADFTPSFEFGTPAHPGYHGHIHCQIGASGGTFFETGGPNFGSMCLASSPKDPMFWRWHGFIDVLYRNYCALQPGACASPSPADPRADPWMADNGTDISNNGTMPSPGTHWISPDVWNRRNPVATDACVGPIDSYGDHVTTGGVVRDCGTSADHENPVSGVTNYLYGTLRNTRPEAPNVVYAEVGVYYALASSGLNYPTNFTLVPESRQFIALWTEPSTTTSIGPIPWTPPPVPPLSDHYCLYMRVLSVQATPPVEGMGIDTDVANNNNLAWRNIKVVAPGDNSPPSFFIVRNIDREREALTLQFELPQILLPLKPTIRITLDPALQTAFKAGAGKTIGLKPIGTGTFQMTGVSAAITGLALAPKAEGHVRVLVATKQGVPADITISQIGPHGVEGGVTLRLAKE